MLAGLYSNTFMWSGACTYAEAEMLAKLLSEYSDVMHGLPSLTAHNKCR